MNRMELMYAALGLAVLFAACVALAVYLYERRHP